MRAFMIAVGAYSELARVTAPCFMWATGLTVEVVTQVPDYGLGPDNPHAHKLHLPGERYMCVDADVVFLRKWEVSQLAQEAFAASRAQVFEPGLGRVLEALGGDRSRFVNTGLFVASSAHAPAMRQAFEWMQTGISRLHEESVLNCALQRCGVTIEYLPDAVNVQKVTSARGPVAAHALRQRSVRDKLRQITWLLGHASRELQEHLVSVGALGAVGRPLRSAPVRGRNLSIRGENRRARLGALTQRSGSSVLGPEKQVPNLVREDVDEQPLAVATGFVAGDDLWKVDTKRDEAFGAERTGPGAAAVTGDTRGRADGTEPDGAALPVVPRSIPPEPPPERHLEVDRRLSPALEDGGLDQVTRIVSSPLSEGGDV